jgi:hypothetical protein
MSTCFSLQGIIIKEHDLNITDIDMSGIIIIIITTTTTNCNWVITRWL